MLIVAIIMFFINSGYYLIVCLRRYFNDIITKETYINLQTSLGSEMLKIENKNIDDIGTGVFIQRLTSDTSRISDVFTNLIGNLSNIITNIGVLVAIFIINKIIFIYIVASLLILYFIDSKRMKKRNENDKKYRKNTEKVSSFVGEMIRGIRDIKMLNSEDSFTNELHSKVKNLNNERYKINKIDRNYQLFSETIYYLLFY